jgi:hypothetical protein
MAEGQLISLLLAGEQIAKATVQPYLVIRKSQILLPYNLSTFLHRQSIFSETKTHNFQICAPLAQGE